MKFEYDNAKYNTARQDWKVGDIIQDDLIGGCLSTAVTTLSIRLKHY